MTTKDMQGKICLVTGATAGIGKVTAIALAGQGAEVIITGRNLQKTEETVRQIKSGTDSEAVHYLLADFADLEQVRVLASTFKERYSRLDVLVNNAGAFYNFRNPTSFGCEMTFLVNHLAPFMLTHLLLDCIQSSAPARIINVASDAHQYATMDFDDLGFKKGYFGFKAYARSKLANVLCSYELARRMAESGVAVNALHPGHIATDIWKTNFSVFGPPLKWIMGFFSLTPEQGADNTIWLASSPQVEGITGKYFDKREAVLSAPISNDENVAKRLWDLSEKLTELRL